MRRLRAMCSTALFCGAMLVSSVGCSPRESVGILRGSEVVYRVRRDAEDALLLRVEIAEGQHAEDVHREGWYVSSAQMSRIFERLGQPDE